MKRIIGIPDDRVALHNNQLVINQKSAQYTLIVKTRDFTLSEEYIAGNSHLIRTQVQPGHSKNHPLESFQAITIPKDYYLVMGDNRDNSADSRVIGLVPRNEIIGRSNMVVFSLNYKNYLMPRNERFFKVI